MLTSVPHAINSASRQVVLMHPNSFSAVVSRKRIVRVEAVPGTDDPSEMGGMPTLGGMGVLRNEDEADFEYDELGPAKMQFAKRYEGASLISRDNGVVPETEREVLIESIANPGTSGYFVAESGDLVAVDMGMGAIVAFEVVSIPTPIGIAPYTRRYLLNPRDDLSYVAPLEA